MILISNILSHCEATCLNSEFRKYGHFSVENNKNTTHLIYNLYFQTAYILK